MRRRGRHARAWPHFGRDLDRTGTPGAELDRSRDRRGGYPHAHRWPPPGVRPDRLGWRRGGRARPAPQTGRGSCPVPWPPVAAAASTATASSATAIVLGTTGVSDQVLMKERLRGARSARQTRRTTPGDALPQRRRAMTERSGTRRSPASRATGLASMVRSWTSRKSRCQGSLCMARPTHLIRRRWRGRTLRARSGARCPGLSPSRRPAACRWEPGASPPPPRTPSAPGRRSDRARSWPSRRSPSRPGSPAARLRRRRFRRSSLCIDIHRCNALI